MAVKPHVTVDGRTTPEQRQGPEPDQHCSSPSAALYLCFALSVYVISHYLSFPSSLALAFLFHSASLTAFQISHVSFFCSFSVSLIFPDLTRGLLPLKECPAQAKAILRLFFERVYFMPLRNIKSKLNKWQSWELNCCLCFWFYYASNQFFPQWKVSLRVLKMLFNGCLHMSLPYMKQPVNTHITDRTTWLRFCQPAGFMWMALDRKGDQLLPFLISLSLIPLQPDW